MATNTMMNRRTGVSNACNTDSNDNDNKRVEEQEKEREIVKENDETTPAERLSSEEKTVSSHIETRRRIQSIADISSFDNLLKCSTLSDDDKLLMQLHYIQGKDFLYIGDMLGYAESTIKKRHKRILKKFPGAGKLIGKPIGDVYKKG